MNGLLIVVGLGIVLTFGAVWGLFYLLERDAEQASKQVSESVFGIGTGALASMAVFVGELAQFGGEVVASIIAIPGLLLALVGIGQSAGVWDLNPGVFALVAVATFLLARAVKSSR